jgi:hypothetical protein
VAPCCVPLWGWVMEQWEGTPWALALAATPWGTRFPVLASSGGERGGAIPVAGPVLAATATHAGRRAWGRRLRQVRRAIPRAWTVLGRAEVLVQPVKTGITPPLAIPSCGQEGEKGRLRRAERLHERQ